MTILGTIETSSVCKACGAAIRIEREEVDCCIDPDCMMCGGDGYREIADYVCDCEPENTYGDLAKDVKP
jgi:hypothetical protein